MAKLSHQMLAVLDSIVCPHPDDEPFPPAHTLKALERRGLIRFEPIPKDATDVTDILMRSCGMMKLRATDAGRKVIADLEGPDALTAPLPSEPRP
jgi:hypothetical protein